MTHWIHTRKTWSQQHDWVTMVTRAREQRRVAQASGMHVDDRYLLCRPHGGLNDILSQVHKTLIHALQYQRQLIIDTRTHGFHDDFCQYFETARRFPSVQLRLSNEDICRFNQLSCFPNSLQARVDHYTLKYVDSLSNYEVADSGEQPQIGIADRPEQLVIHDQCGGGRGCQALPYLKFTPQVAAEITTKLLSLPQGYEAVHIRYSDVPFDYAPFLEVLREALKGRSVVVCTDSFAVLKACKEQLTDSAVYSLGHPPQTSQKIHDNPGVTTPTTNTNALVDLLTLALAKKIYFPSGQGVYPSGFSILAADLSNRDDLKRQLLGRTNWREIQQHLHGGRFPTPGAGVSVSP